MLSKPYLSCNELPVLFLLFYGFIFLVYANIYIYIYISYWRSTAICARKNMYKYHNFLNCKEGGMFIYLPRNSANPNPPIITQRDTPMTNPQPDRQTDAPIGWVETVGGALAGRFWFVRWWCRSTRFACFEIGRSQRFWAAERPLKTNELLPYFRAWRHGGKALSPGFPAEFDRSARGRNMDVIPMCSIFQELQSVLDTGYLSALPSLEEYWQQVI